MIKKLITTLLLSASALLCTTPAYAQEAEISPKEAEQAKEARALFDEGNVALRAGDYAKAQDALERSFNIRASFDTAANLGQAEMMQGMYVLAARHFEYSLRNFPTGENRDLKKAVSKLFAQVKPKVVTIHAKVSPSGARVTFGDHDLGSAPINYPLFAKPHVRYLLTAQGPDGKTTSVEIIGDAGETKDVELSLDEGGKVPAVSSGLESTEAPWAKDSDVESEPSSRKRNWVPAYILGGVTVAALGSSFVFRGLAGSSVKKKDDAQAGLSDSACSEAGTVPAACTEIEEYGNRANTQATIADATIIAGAALGAVTLGYVLFTLGKNPSNKSSQATLSAERGGASFFFSGHF